MISLSKIMVLCFFSVDRELVWRHSSDCLRCVTHVLSPIIIELNKSSPSNLSDSRNSQRFCEYLVKKNSVEVWKYHINSNNCHSNFLHFLITHVLFNSSTTIRITALVECFLMIHIYMCLFLPEHKIAVVILNNLWKLSVNFCCSSSWFC